MQQSIDAVSGSGAASSMSNASSDLNSGYRFQHDFSTLTEMFPSCDPDVLRNYLEIFSDQPNYMSTIIDMLLQGDNTSGSNLSQNPTQEQYGLKRKTDDVGDSLCGMQAGAAVVSPDKLQRIDSGRNETDHSLVILGEEEELDSKAGMFSSNKGESFTSSSTNSDKKGASPLKSPVRFTDDKESEIVFVKSVPSSPKQSFHRTGYSKPGPTSPWRHNGICIRYKGGVPHPSMNKPKKLQIVEIDADGKSNNSTSNAQSVSNRDQSVIGHSPRRKSLSNNYSKSSSTKTSTMVHCMEPSGSAKDVQVDEATSSGTRSKQGASATAAISDLEILKKVFPDADPAHISSLLDKYADEPNRVALVGKELGNKPDPQAQNVKKKAPLPRVTWFWQSENSKLVPFTDSECNVLEKAFQSCEPHDSGDASVKVITLPGSIKRYNVNFLRMKMACENGKESLIFRVPEGSEDKKEISGKSLIPQEALTVPNDWQQQSGSVELVSVRPGSAEWDHVQRSLKRSLRTAHVVDIQRVQNKWLYRKYAIQRHLIKDKNGPACINEKELFHGTRHTSPDTIWKGEDGFDMRYSADGMWGRGTYFASEASYCHQGFVHRDARTQHFQLFLAHVLTGDSISLPPDRSLKMPPLKGGSNIRYDSINGITNNCTVYILYKLDMAYPAYLITYTLTRGSGWQ